MVDIGLVKDIASAFFAVCGAWYYRKAERSNKASGEVVRVNNEAVEKINGHADLLPVMRRRLVAHSRQIQALKKKAEEDETTRLREARIAAVELSNLEARVKMLESRGS